MKIKNLRDIYEENSKVVVTTLREHSDVFFGKTIGWSHHTSHVEIIDNDPTFEVPDDWDGYVTGIEVDYDIVEENDLVNHPSHYKHLPVEVIDIIEPTIKNYPRAIGYHIGNVIKYVLRAPFKGNMKKDLEKARFYLDRAISKLEDKKDDL